MKKNKKLNWVTITGIATVGATVISAFVFLFGEGVLRRNLTASEIPSSNSATPFQTQMVSSSPDTLHVRRISLNLLISARNDIATFTLNYIELERDSVLLHITIDNSKDNFNLLTCGLPKLTKNQYGEVSPLKEKGGFYVGVSESCFLGIFSDVLIDMRTKQDGWLVYQVDLSRFRLEGLYSLNNLGEFFPTITFEINDKP